MILSRDQVLTNPLPTVDVECPELGGALRVRTLSIQDRMLLEQAIERHKDAPLACVICAFTLVDDTGAPLFTEDDIPVLKTLDSRPLIRATKAADKLNAFARADVDELQKNS